MKKNMSNLIEEIKKTQTPKGAFIIIDDCVDGVPIKSKLFKEYHQNSRHEIMFFLPENQKFLNPYDPQEMGSLHSRKQEMEKN